MFLPGFGGGAFGGGAECPPLLPPDDFDTMLSF